MSAPRFGVLGPLEVRGEDGAPVALGGPRPRALLALLLLDAGRLVSTERLIDGQWGENPPAGAVNAIQAQVSRLRRQLPPDLIEFHGSGYRLAVDPDDVDAHRFEHLAAEGRALLAAAQPERAAATLRQALALWRGPALPEVAHAGAQVARLDEVRLAATEDLIEAELALPAGTSVGSLRQLVSAHPLRERLRGQLMRALHAGGQQAAALEVFEEGRRLLADELGADPSPELAELHLAMLRAVAPRASRRLPAPLTSFVGREAELDRLATLTDRLVTITGPGGTGKTRLALESARRGGRDVCFVDLSAVADDGLVPHAVMGALGVRETGLGLLQPQDPVERIVSALADRDLLLVLDNCEHVVAAAALLTRRLLDACPKLSVLATSREPLGLTGEVLVPLAPLALPPAGAAPGEWTRAPAVRLFTERASAVRPGFEPGPEVVEICTALDGSPLAIELAAARLRSFTVAEIAARLAEHGRFKLLSRGDRTAAARHRTLHAVVDWSWSLLSEEEQVVARRLSVFAGGAGLEAVERVCGDGEVLADLVDKSFVEAADGRYRMYETVRLFCAEKLEEAGDTARDVHAAYFLELVREADPWLLRAEQLDWLARLSAEQANLQAALRHAVHHDPGMGLRLAGAQAAYWFLSGRRGQAAASARELLDQVGEPPAELGEEYVLCVLLAVPDVRQEQWARAEAIMNTLDRTLRYPFGTVLWGMVAGPGGAGVERRRRERMLGPEPWSRAVSVLGEALIHQLDGRLAEAERGLESALASFTAVGERWGMAQGLESLATLASWRGEWARARELWQRALDLLGELGADDEVVDILCRRAGGLLREGDQDAAAADLARAAELARTTGRPATVEFTLGELADVRGDLAAARAHYESVLTVTQPGVYVTEGLRPFAQTALARLAVRDGDPERARALHAEALTGISRSLAGDLATVVEGHAGLALLDGTAERAAYLLGAAVALRGMAVTGDRAVAEVAAAATLAIGAERFATQYAKGAALSRDEALTVLS
ncbi:BTAD domain-containing putative transcriptional regulator [Nonomuraea endophytica]|uniref:Putative ATPase/DNA-binding winged helix-turn-helix (WHTH) protein n=1 Tax=Nonomuraea endophytica TaxID=714136 RepID=A0A7W7ZX71_9ACTN|nr:BTAD domain-containing putative transcriptional regulator [Nonomuraea endophytica]MBB5075472.1 putative ATPase/DNA-binding winged helix-turn-helix (wHTH) protein [Nonomuraea endophytica]